MCEVWWYLLANQSYGYVQVLLIGCVQPHSPVTPVNTMLFIWVNPPNLSYQQSQLPVRLLTEATGKISGGFSTMIGGF